MTAHSEPTADGSASKVGLLSVSEIDGRSSLEKASFVEVDDSNKEIKEKKVFGPIGEWNACISFLLFASQVYLTYVAIFNRDITLPFKTYGSNNSANNTSLDDGNSTATLAISSLSYGSSLLSVLIILTGGIICGYLVQLCRLPGLLGMLLCGIILRNVPLTGGLMFVLKDWGVALRRTAFIIILLRGGLSLDAVALKKLKGACLRLALIPCTVEAVTIALAAKLILDMDILFGLMLGFVLAAVSPAVVVPAMLEASQEGYGKAAGVPTLIVAAASLDDVYAITMYSLLVTVVFSTGSGVLMTIVRAPVEVLSGVFFGTVVGLVLRYFPSRDQKNLHLIRISLLMAFSMSLLFGTTVLGADAIGAIAVLVSAFIAGCSWKQEGPLPEEDYLALAWQLCFQPLLFGLIGFELSFDMISLRSVGLGLLVLLCGLVLRTVAASLAVLGTGLTFKERLFVALAWLPKATVQAALAPAALDMALAGGSAYPSLYVDQARLIFAVAVLSILTTAPIGAFIIRVTSPRLLKKSTDSTEDDLGDIQLH